MKRSAIWLTAVIALGLSVPDPSHFLQETECAARALDVQLYRVDVRESYSFMVKKRRLLTCSPAARSLR
jgi:hypothetical protein